MKSEYINSSSTINSALESLKKEGSADVSDGVFRFICGVVLVSSVMVSALICNCGVDYIEDNFAVNSWSLSLIALVLLSVFNGWVFYHMIKMAIVLWKMTKEEDEE